MLKTIGDQNGDHNQSYRSLLEPENKERGGVFWFYFWSTFKCLTILWIILSNVYLTYINSKNPIIGSEWRKALAVAQFFYSCIKRLTSLAHDTWPDFLDIQASPEQNDTIQARAALCYLLGTLAYGGAKAFEISKLLSNLFGLALFSTPFRIIWAVHICMCFTVDFLYYICDSNDYAKYLEYNKNFEEEEKEKSCLSSVIIKLAPYLVILYNSAILNSLNSLDIVHAISDSLVNLDPNTINIILGVFACLGIVAFEQLFYIWSNASYKLYFDVSTLNCTEKISLILEPFQKQNKKVICLFALIYGAGCSTLFSGILTTISLTTKLTEKFPILNIFYIQCLLYFFTNLSGLPSNFLSLYFDQKKVFGDSRTSCLRNKRMDAYLNNQTMLCCFNSIVACKKPIEHDRISATELNWFQFIMMKFQMTDEMLEFDHYYNASDLEKLHRKQMEDCPVELIGQSTGKDYKASKIWAFELGAFVLFAIPDKLQSNHEKIQAYIGNNPRIIKAASEMKKDNVDVLLWSQQDDQCRILYSRDNAYIPSINLC